MKKIILLLLFTQFFVTIDFAQQDAQFSQNMFNRLAINPGYAGVYYKLGDAYSRVQKFEEAERMLQQCIWVDATSTGPYILMGKVLEKKGETELAIRALRRALAMDPNNSMTHHLLGQAFRDLGRTEDADRELKEAERLKNLELANP